MVFVLTMLAGACTAAAPVPSATAAPTLVPNSVPATALVTAPAPGATPLPSTTASPMATLTSLTATPNPTLVVGLIGLWQGPASFYLFSNDGTWNWDPQRAAVETAPENLGRWWMEGDVFNIQDLSGKDPCPRDQTGTYQVHVDGDSLSLTRLKDPCVVRTAKTAGQYTRLPAGP